MEQPNRTAFAQEVDAQGVDELSLFAGQLGHDLRTPLTAILANAEMLAAEPGVAEDPELAWMVDGIDRAARRMDAMIEQMVQFASRRTPPRPTRTPLATVVELALDDLAPELERRQAEILVAELPLLTVDPEQMREAVHHLLSNALKFARPGTPPRVEVGAERRDGRWRVSVTDDGIGVAPEQREAMFVLFARADKRVEGSGIGLAEVKRILEAHGGCVGIDGAPGGGTTVWFELPA